MSDDITPLHVGIASLVLMMLGGFLAWGVGGCLFAIGLGALLLALKG